MGYPEKFDTSKLTDEQQTILANLQKRRAAFDDFLTKNKIQLFTCPGCGYPTLEERGAYEICSVCNWENDDQDDIQADEIWGGPNYKLSLTENRLIIGTKLAELERRDNGMVNDNPLEVLAILHSHDKEITELLKSIPGSATVDHPLFEKYRQKGRDLLEMLIKR